VSVFIAYPDGRIGRESKEYFRQRFGYVPDIENRNRFQNIGEYDFMITKARNVPRAIEEGCLFGITGLDFLREYGNPDLDIVETLTGRERLMLQLAATDCSEAEIADRLGINPGAAALLLGNLMRKLGLQRQDEVSGL